VILILLFVPALAYVRPLVEFNSIMLLPDTIEYTVAVEGVQRRFNKKLPVPGLHSYRYLDKLRRLQLPTLELRRLYADIVYVVL